MAKGIKINQEKISNLIAKGITSPGKFYDSLKQIAKERVSAGIKGEHALIMGVLNFGDPLHTFPNNSKDSPIRKTAKKNGVEGVRTLTELNPIPSRPFLTTANSSPVGKANIEMYINDNGPKLLAGMIKGKGIKKTSQRALSVKDFMQGLANIMAINIQYSYEYGEWTPNAPATLANKTNDKPLHGKIFTKDDIKGWVNGR